MREVVSAKIGKIHPTGVHGTNEVYIRNGAYKEPDGMFRGQPFAGFFQNHPNQDEETSRIKRPVIIADEKQRTKLLKERIRLSELGEMIQGYLDDPTTLPDGVTLKKLATESLGTGRFVRFLDKKVSIEPYSLSRTIQVRDKYGVVKNDEFSSIVTPLGIRYLEMTGREQFEHEGIRGRNDVERLEFILGLTNGETLDRFAENLPVTAENVPKKDFTTGTITSVSRQHITIESPGARMVFIIKDDGQPIDWKPSVNWSERRPIVHQELHRGYQVCITHYHENGNNVADRIDVISNKHPNEPPGTKDRGYQSGAAFKYETVGRFLGVRNGVMKFQDPVDKSELHFIVTPEAFEGVDIFDPIRSNDRVFVRFRYDGNPYTRVAERVEKFSDDDLSKRNSNRGVVGQFLKVENGFLILLDSNTKNKMHFKITEETFGRLDLLDSGLQAHVRYRVDSEGSIPTARSVFRG